MDLKEEFSKKENIVLDLYLKIAKQTNNEEVISIIEDTLKSREAFDKTVVK